MAKSFDADFYVTCATVIPVLFLTAAVQRQAFVFLLNRVGRRTVRHRELGLLRLRASVILIAGVVGEVIALLALYWRSEMPWQRPTVLAATLILLTVFATAPINAYANLVEKFLDHPTLERPPERAAPSEAEGLGDGGDGRGDA